MGLCKQWKNSDGTISYQYRIRSQKLSSPIIQTFKNKTDGKAWVAETKAAIRLGRYTQITHSRFTVTSLIDEFISSTFSNRRSIGVPLQTLTWWKNQIGHMYIEDVTKSVIKFHWKGTEKIRSSKTKKFLSPRTINSYIETLSACFSWAVNEDYIAMNPVLALKRKPVNNSRDRILDQNETRDFLNACKSSSNRYLYPAVILSLVTGGRRAEILGLKWSDINLKTGEMTFRFTKNGSDRSVIVTGHSLEQLHELAKVRALNCELIFAPLKTRNGGVYSTPWEDLRAPFKRACKEANINNFRWHDLRHCAASSMLMSGGSLPEIMKVLGHKSPAMSWRYASLDKKRNRELAECVEKRYLKS